MKSEDIEKQLTVALDYARKLVHDYGKIPNIPVEHQEVLRKYLGKHVYAALRLNGHKISTPTVSRDIYYTSLMADEFFGVPMICWFYILKHVMAEAGIENNLSLASARSYVASPWRYLPSEDDLKVFPHAEFSREELKKWKLTLEKLL